MPWRLVFAIIVLAFIVTFIGFNLENGSNVSFGFHTLVSVPVYLTVFTSFTLGLFSSIPIIISSSLKAKKKKDRDKEGRSSAAIAPEIPVKTRRRKNRKNLSLEDGSYGID